MIHDEVPVELASPAEIVNSGLLTAEISAANNYDLDFEVWNIARALD